MIVDAHARLEAKRTRLLALVKSAERPVHAQRAGDPLDLARGDVRWFRDNISCQAACPANTDVARYIAHIASGDHAAAYRVNAEDNVFPGILGRICARPCEAACRRGKVDQPIAICALKRGATDLAGRHVLPERPARTRAERVAIVGAGPAGLTAANDLAKLGYGVALYDELPILGGMLTAGIPEFRLPREVTRHEIDAHVEALGVAVHLNTRVGRDVGLREMLAEYQAVVLAAGCQVPQPMDIPGEDAPGVVAGLAFMEALNLGQPMPVGERVVVVGGGFTAMDCCRAAVRLGGRSVRVLYRRSAAEMPVPEEELAEAEREGVRFEYLVQPLAVEVGRDGALRLLCQRTRLGAPDERGRRRPEPIRGSEFSIECDTVVAATGQTADLSWLPEELTLQRTAAKRVRVDELTFATSVPGLFAAGDWTGGPRNVISAVADGRKVAFAVDQHFRGVGSAAAAELTLTPRFSLVSPTGRPPGHWLAAPERTEQRVGEQPQPATPGEAALAVSGQPVSPWTRETMVRRLVIGDPYETMAREAMPTIAAQERALAAEVESGLTAEQQSREAQRCLQCQLNIFVDGPRCILCNTCVDVCPQKVIAMLPLERVASIDGHPAPADLLRAREWPHAAAMVIDESTCVRCGLCVEYCPTKCITMQSFEPVATAPSRAPIALLGELGRVMAGATQ